MLNPEGEYEGDPKDMAYGIRDLAGRLYQQNYKGGFDVKGYRGYMVMLFGLLGMMAGGICGAFVNHFGNKYKWWGEDKKPKEALQWRNRRAY